MNDFLKITQSGRSWAREQTQESPALGSLTDSASYYIQKESITEETFRSSTATESNRGQLKQENNSWADVR